MKKYLRLSLLITMVITIALNSGCVSKDGIILTNALRKNMEAESYENQSKITFNFTPKTMDSNDDFDQYLDIINNLSITNTSKHDLENNNYYIESNIKSNGISITGLSYLNAQKAWLKFPHKSKYIEIDPTILAPEHKDKSSIEMNKEFKKITFDFLKEYIVQYNYSLKNIKNMDKSIISTPEGNKQVTNIQISLDRDELRNLFEYTIKNVVNTDLSKDYIKSLVTLINNSVDTTKIQGYNYEEILLGIDNTFEEGRKLVKENPEEFVDSVLDELGYIFKVPYNEKNAVVLTCSIDENGYIVKFDAEFNFIISDNYDNSDIMLCNINYSSMFYNINNTTVEMPIFTSNNTIPFKKYVLSNYSLKNSPIGEILGVGTKTIDFTTGITSARTNYSDNILEVAPYIIDGTTLVPGKFLGESLGMKVDWDENLKTLTLTDNIDNKKLLLKEGSRAAYLNKRQVLLPTAPEMKNGVLMVPVKVVSEQFDAYVSGYPSYEYEGEFSIYITK